MVKINTATNSATSTSRLLLLQNQMATPATAMINVGDSDLWLNTITHNRVDARMQYLNAIFLYRLSRVKGIKYTNSPAASTHTLGTAKLNHVCSQPKMERPRDASLSCFNNPPQLFYKKSNCLKGTTANGNMKNTAVITTHAMAFFSFFG